jgi:hypothetical protein
MNPLHSSRAIGVERVGGSGGTNLDPQLLEDDRRASWAALTNGRVPERMTSMAAEVPERDLAWSKTNAYYVRNPGRGKRGR